MEIILAVFDITLVLKTIVSVPNESRNRLLVESCIELVQSKPIDISRLRLEDFGIGLQYGLRSDL